VWGLDLLVDVPSYDAEWFYDLGAGLSYWVIANETATKRAVEQGEGLVDAYTSELGEWAFRYILDMEGVPSVSVDVANVFLTLSGAVQAALRALGLDTILNDIRNKFVDYMLRTTLGMSEQQFRSFLLAEANQTLFPNSLNDIISDLGQPPPENGWVHDNRAHSFFQQFIRGINGALYNSVILGKIALLDPSELNRLTRSQYYSYAGIPNALLGFIKGIDYSTQWLQGSGYGGFLGYRFPPDFPTFTYLFKPSPPGRSDASLWIRPGTQVSAVIKATVNAPNGSSAFSDSNRYMPPLLIRKKSATTGAWQEVSGRIENGVFTSLELPFEYGTEYLVRPIHGSMDFTGPLTVKFDTPVDLREMMFAVQAAASAPYNPAAYTGLLDPFYSYKTAVQVRPWCQLLAPQQPLGIEGNFLGLPSSAPLKLTNCRLRVDGTYGPALTGMRGVLLVDPRENAVAPAAPVKIGFAVDMNGVARWGAANLAEAARGPDQVTLKTGSHPGSLVMRVVFDVSDASLAGARVAEGYRRVQAGLMAISAGQSGADIQAVTAAVANLPNVIDVAATAEARMRTAIAAVADARVRQDLQQRFDAGLATFPDFTARGLVPAPDSPWFSVHPNLGGVDSRAVPPSFSAAALSPAPAPPGSPPDSQGTGKPTKPGTGVTPPKEPTFTPPQDPKPSELTRGGVKPPEPPKDMPPRDPKPPSQAPATTAPSAPTTLRSDSESVPFGGERTIGAKSPLALSIRRVEYRATAVRAGSSLIRPAADEKLLVVRFTLRNPGSKETWLSWSSVSFRAVDAKGMNREDLQEFFNEQTGESVDASLQPNQKIDAYTVITMPARGPATLLRAQAEDGNPLEFALGSAVAALQPPFADPTDPTGASALAEVPAAIGESIMVGNFSMSVEKVAYTRGPIQESGPSKGSQFLVANLRVKNQAPADQPLAWDSFDFTLRAPDGDDVPWNGELLAAKRDDTVEVTATPGREIALRIYFEVPLELRPAALFAREGAGGRGYLIDVSGVK
jgi:hypothetical protein